MTPGTRSQRGKEGDPAEPPNATLAPSEVLHCTRAPRPAGTLSGAGLSPALQPPAGPSNASTSAAFQGLSPALQAGIGAPFQPTGLAAPPPPNPGNVPPPAQRAPPPSLGATPQVVAAPTTAAFQGLSPALQPSQPSAGAFRGLSPALAAGLSPALAAGVQPQAPAPAVVAPPVPPPPPGAHPDALYHEGVALLEQGNWTGADEKFSQALLLLSQAPQGEFRRCTPPDLCDRCFAIVASDSAACFFFALQTR